MSQRSKRECKALQADSLSTGHAAWASEMALFRFRLERCSFSRSSSSQTSSKAFLMSLSVAVLHFLRRRAGGEDGGGQAELALPLVCCCCRLLDGEGDGGARLDAYSMASSYASWSSRKRIVARSFASAETLSGCVCNARRRYAFLISTAVAVRLRPRRAKQQRWSDDMVT